MNPVFLIAQGKGAGHSSEDALAKTLVSSLCRSQFQGNIVHASYNVFPLFRVERRSVHELILPPSEIVSNSEPVIHSSGRFQNILSALTLINPSPRQWVVVADVGGLAMRNIDHLLPSDSDELYAARQTDLLWCDHDKGRCATPGFWAVRGECLPTVLEALQEALKEAPPSLDTDDEVAIWGKVISKLPLRKKRFEAGEIAVPSMKSLDWNSISRAAFVTLSHWPEAEQRKFLQAMYFGLCFGDKSGFILNLIDP